MPEELLFNPNWAEREQSLCGQVVASGVFSYYNNTVRRSIGQRGDTKLPTMILSMLLPTALFLLNWNRTLIRRSSSALDQVERERFSKSFGLISLMSGSS